MFVQNSYLLIFRELIHTMNYEIQFRHKTEKKFSDDNSHFSRNHFWDWSFVWIFFFVKLDIVQQWSADWVLLSLSCNWKEICLVFYQWFICWDQKVFEVVFHKFVWSLFCPIHVHISQFYFHINFGNRLYSKMKRPVSKMSPWKVRIFIAKQNFLFCV